jgi:hypothetical protein
MRGQARLPKSHVDDDEYVEAMYDEVQNSIQRGMTALACRRALPLFG